MKTWPGYLKENLNKFQEEFDDNLVDIFFSKKSDHDTVKEIMDNWISAVKRSIDVTQDAINDGDYPEEHMREFKNRLNYIFKAVGKSISGLKV